MAESLRDLVKAELAQPVEPRISATAAAIAARHGDASQAVLFYGSCLRSAELEGQMLDFYLIVSDYWTAYDKAWFSFANRLVPPNVFPFQHESLAAKYAVLSEADFLRLNGRDTLSVSVWARFAQPSRLVWRASGEAAERVITAVACAAPTLLAAAWPLFRGSGGLDLWRHAFALTYAAELRTERQGRATSVVDANSDRYRRFTAPALEHAAIDTSAPVSEGERRQAEARWARRRRAGKLLSIARIAKASTTYAGGIDYLAWKINRHAGTDIKIKSWQRRWPLLGAVVLLPRLLKRGAIR